MGSILLEDLTPDTRAATERFIAEAKDNGIELKIASTLRSCSEQAEIYAQGRTKPGKIVSNAPGCRSWHVFGRAVDLFIRNSDGTLQLEADPRYEVLGQIAEDMGFVWGGRWGDAGHFEYHPGLHIEDVCPDPTDCEMAVARYGSTGNYFVPAHLSEDTAEDAASTAASTTFKDVLVSAVVGALVFQVISYATRRVVR